MYHPNHDFIHAAQARCARVAVSPSAVRGQRSPGLVAKARDFLAELPLKPFGISQPSLFRKRLDRTTEDLMAALSRRGRSWGVARKLLNIFLRDALYTFYLRDRFKLDRAEELLELPLDSITAKHLRAACARKQVPTWRTVKGLTPADSDTYQNAAAEVAKQRKVARVHLDAFWWTDRPTKGA